MLACLRRSLINHVIYNKYISKNLRLVILKLLKEYNISRDKIRSFILNNTLLNNTTISFILKELCP